ncbi:Plastocyanin-like domain [Musa troglodytarum]|uniref:Plastocyanin-like domain n=1 Tax=Musa troglodytarum TaxID=320322 RepID=A0A9E7GMT5_9LILI|nr:Plastocyanin-like domain [Musa troglodytarum]
MANHSCAGFLSFFVLVPLLMVAVESGLEFHVGGSRGWIVPAGDEAESYNRWAMRNRFHVGDSVYFKYKNDSVLVVDREAYGDCNTTDPLLAFDDGNTTFRFDRYGFFFFISGTPGHCEAGQRLIVRVMVHPEFAAAGPGPAPGLQPGGGSGSSSGSDSDFGSSSGSDTRPKRSDAAHAHVGFWAIMPGLGVVMSAVLSV